MQYVELHAHSNFSLLDGACFPGELVEAARIRGMKALALTDHDGLYGVPQFCRSARAAGIKPIVGAELTLENACHITLLAKDARGYGNLSRLVTRAQLSGSKGSPRLAFDHIAALSGGLICLSGCKKGEIASLLLQGKREDALEAARRYMSVFPPGSLYLEMQHHLDPEDRSLCRKLMDLAKKTGIPPVAANNVHYRERSGHRLHDVLVCIRNRVGLDDSAPFRRPNSEYYLKDHEEMLLLPGLPPEAISRTLAVAEACAFAARFFFLLFPGLRSSAR